MFNVHPLEQGFSNCGSWTASGSWKIPTSVARI